MRFIFRARWWRELLAVLIAVLYATVLLILLLNIQGRISIESTDTFTYADTARQIASGQGITTRIIQPFVDVPQMPQVTWPPFFPFLVAIPMAFGVPLAQALMTTPLVVIAISGAIFLWYVARRWGVLPALFFSAFSLTAAPLLHVAAQPMTEAVFMGFSLLIVILFWEISERAWTIPSLIFSVVLGFLLAGLGLVRYLGFAVMPGIFLLLFLMKKRRQLMFCFVGFAVLTFPFLIRNFIVYHKYSNKRFPTDAVFFLNVQDAFVGIGKDFFHYLLWPSIRMVVALALVAVIYAWAKRRRHHAAPETQSIRFGLVLVYLAVVYVVGMMVTRTLFFFDKLNTPRFEAPVEWLALAGVSLIAASLIGRVRWLAWVVGILILVQGIRTVPSLYRTPRHDRLPDSGWQVQWVAEHTEPKSLILSNVGHSFNFFLGRTVVALRQYREPSSVEELKAWTDNWQGVFANTYVVVTKELDPGRHTDLTVALSKGEQIPDFLEPLPDAPSSLFAYRVRSQ